MSYLCNTAVGQHRVTSSIDSAVSPPPRRVIALRNYEPRLQPNVSEKDVSVSLPYLFHVKLLFICINIIYENNAQKLNHNLKTI